MEDRTQKVKDKIKVYEDDKMTDSPKYKALKDELKSLTKGSGSASDRVFIIPGTAGIEPEELAKETSSGLIGIHPAEAGMPFVKTPGKSFAFPFTITGGKHEGREGAIYAGLSAEGRWKLIEILNTLGVAYIKTKEGVGFNPADAAGKATQVQYTGEKDNRSADEGGTGNIIPKATKFLPLGAEIESML